MLSFKFSLSGKLGLTTLSLGLVFFCTPMLAEPKPSATLEFNLADKHGAPDKQALSKFDCLDKIYAVTDIKNMPKGKHTIEYRWMNPHGETQETTRYNFHVKEATVTNLWSWLQLSRGRGAGLFQWLDPSTGLEEFIGEWRVELFVNGKELQRATFEVNC